MAGYKPKKTLLIHELFRKGGPLPAMTAGGWDDTARTFSPVTSYEAYKAVLAADHFGRPACEVFLDAFTAGVEAGDLDNGNWFRAFDSRADWQEFAADLKNGGPRWLNDRARQAFGNVLTELSIPRWEVLSGLEALGNGLAVGVNWAMVGPSVVAGPKASVTHLKLVKAG